MATALGLGVASAMLSSFFTRSSIMSGSLGSSKVTEMTSLMRLMHSQRNSFSTICFLILTLKVVISRVPTRTFFKEGGRHQKT